MTETSLPNTYTVYGIYQDGTELVYVGSTMQPLRARFNQHKCRTKQKRISIYINSVGREHFSIKPILTNIETKEEAFAKEKALTLMYKAKGYNLQNVNAANSYVITENQREKFRLAKLGKCNNSRSKKIICVETGAVYPSISEAGRQLNVKRANIEQALLKGILYTSAGYHWKYVI